MVGVNFRRQLLEELTEYTHGCVNVRLGNKTVSCKDWKELMNGLPSDSITDAGDAKKWRQLFTPDMVQSCVAKIRHVSLGERLVSLEYSEDSLIYIYNIIYNIIFYSIYII